LLAPGLREGSSVDGVEAQFVNQLVTERFGRSAGPGDRQGYAPRCTRGPAVFEQVAIPDGVEYLDDRHAEPLGYPLAFCDAGLDRGDAAVSLWVVVVRLDDRCPRPGRGEYSLGQVGTLRCGMLMITTSASAAASLAHTAWAPVAAAMSARVCGPRELSDADAVPAHGEEPGERPADHAGPDDADLHAQFPSWSMRFL